MVEERGIKNGQKYSDVFYGRPHITHTLWAITQLGQRKLAQVIHRATAAADSRLLQPVQNVPAKSRPEVFPADPAAATISMRPVMP